MFGFDNVHFDENSMFSFNELNETVFLESVFISLGNIFPEFEQYHFYIFSSTDATIEPASTKKMEKNKILIYISEERGEVLAKEIVESYLLIFKMYFDRHVHPQATNMFSLPLGITKHIPELPHIPVKNRRIDIFFSGNLHNNRYDFYLAFLQKKFPVFKIFPTPKKNKLNFFLFRLFKLGIRSFGKIYKNCNSVIEFTDGFQRGFDPASYAEILQHTKVAFSPSGGYSVECFRTYEALRAGCIVISEKLPDISYYNDSPIIQVDSWKGIHKTVRDLLADPQRLDELSSASVAYYQQCFSGEGVARYIIQTMFNFSTQKE